MPAKKQAKKELDDDTYYIGITEPLEVRRTILETSKEIIQAMHRFERFKEIREEKKSTLKDLNQKVSELSILLNTLKSNLPKSTARIKQAQEMLNKEAELKVLAQKVEIAETKKVEKDVTTSKNTEKSSVIAAKPPKKEPEMTDMQKLELELNEIENKLSSLSK